ncbi:NUDIX hydrolase [Oscillatoriales cyanobacterium USR001]|nr:NUDIX hydrolase [Oscillatoriales cyanobacterium USR001]
MTELKKWKLVRSQLVLNHHWCQIRQDTIELPNGTIIDDFFVNIRPDIALIFPVTPLGEIVFVRQYRHGIGEILLELPAGRFNPQEETAISAASRELTEETGYVAEQLTLMATFYDNPVKDTNHIHLFFAKNVKLIGKRQLDLTEDIEVVLVPIVKVKEKIFKGEICVSGTVAAIFLGLDLLSQIVSKQ